MVRRVILVSVVALAFVGCAHSACDPGWTESGSNCYFISHDLETWHSADVICGTFKAHLAEIHTFNDHREITDVTTTMADAKPGGFWIGLTDDKQEGQYYWANSGTAMASGDYANWGHDQPNDHQHAQNCVFLNSHNGHWFDGACSLKKYYVCEKDDMTGSTTPPTIVG